MGNADSTYQSLDCIHCMEWKPVMSCSWCGGHICADCLKEHREATDCKHNDDTEEPKSTGKEALDYGSNT